MTTEERLIKLESEFLALLASLGKEVVWRKRRTGIADSPFKETPLVVCIESAK